MTRRLANIVLLLAAIAFCYGLQVSKPHYGDLIGPIPSRGKIGDTVVGRGFEAHAEKVEFARNLKTDRFGKTMVLTTGGIWAVVTVTLTARAESTTIGTASWRGATGLVYDQTERLSFTDGLLPVAIDPGLPTGEAGLRVAAGRGEQRHAAHLGETPVGARHPGRDLARFDGRRVGRAAGGYRRHAGFVAAAPGDPMTVLDAGREQEAGERKWRHRSLWSLVLLLPLALAVETHDSVKALLAGNDLFERRVAWGQSAHFGGSDWKLTDLRGAFGMANLPPDSVPVLADFLVKVGDPDLKTLWLGCKVMLIDAEGRRWLPTSAIALNAPGDVQTCTSAIFSGARSGDTINLRETFLVSKEATKSIRPAVGVASERPRFLLFQLEKD